MQAETKKLIKELRDLIKRGQDIPDSFKLEATLSQDTKTLAMIRTADTIYNGILNYLAKWEREHQ